MTTSSPADATAPTKPKPISYRWVLILLALAVAVSVLLVYAENRVYQPTTPFAGGTGDHVHAFALDPAHARHFYIGTHYGFFRTTDGGASWTRLNDASGLAPTLVATSISISPLDSRAIYVAGYRLDTGNPAGLAVSRDDGAHWRTLPTGPTGNLFPDPRILFVTAGWAQPGETFAYAFAYGLFRSLDYGAHWQRLAAPFSGQVTAFTPVMDCPGTDHAATGSHCAEQLLVGTTQGLFAAVDANAAPVAFAPVSDITAYVYAIAAQRATGAVYVSTQQGIFAAASTGASFSAVASVAEGGPTLTSLAVSGANQAVVYGVTAQNIVETSRDSGHTWQATGKSLLNRDLSQLSSGLRSATGNNTPQWAGGQNTFLTLLQAPADGTGSVYAAISFPVQVFNSGDGGQSWRDLGQG